MGTLNLLVPQDREGTFSTRLFARYQRNEKALCFGADGDVRGGGLHQEGQGDHRGAVRHLFLKEPPLLFGHLPRLGARGLEDRRRLEAESYPYVFVDARYEKVRVDGRVVSQGVLVVSALRDDGFREICGVEVADTESEATYHELFLTLKVKARGLEGVELVVSDDHEGLKAAIDRHFQGASWQRCQVHYARNLLGMVGHDRRKELAEGLRGVFAAASTEVALRLAHELADRWRESHPKVSEHLEEHVRSASLPGLPRLSP